MPPCPRRSPCVMFRAFRPFRRQPPLVVRWSVVWLCRTGLPEAAPLGSASSLAGIRASFGFRLFLAGSPRRQAESRSYSYGRVVHLPLLSTSPHGDAVTFGYEAQTEPRRGLAPRGHRTLASALALQRADSHYATSYEDENWLEFCEDPARGHRRHQRTASEIWIRHSTTSRSGLGAGP